MKRPFGVHVGVGAVAEAAANNLSRSTSSVPTANSAKASSALTICGRVDSAQQIELDAPKESKRPADRNEQRRRW